MAQLIYNTLRPFSNQQPGLPRLLQPYEELNGKIQNNTFQYQPSDAPNFWKDGGNLVDYTEDEMLYTTNKQGFRGNKIVKNETILMTAGCSHTYGIGVRDNEVWGSKLAEQLDMYHINVGVGGIGCDSVVLIVKQFFEEGVIPDTLAVLWPSLNRKMIVSNKSKKLDDQIMDFLIEPVEKFDPFIFQFQPSNPLPNDSSIIQNVKGYLLQSEQQNLLSFWMYRELLISLCKMNNVKLIEAFTEPEGRDYVTAKCNNKIPCLKTVLQDSYIDYARDNLHFGIKTHSQLADSFKIL